jgi:hypothetical protein
MTTAAIELSISCWILSDQASPEKMEESSQSLKPVIWVLMTGSA